MTMNHVPLDDEAIFNVARKMPPEQRADYLQQACGDDEALSSRVVALLHVSDEHQEFLEQPASPAVATFEVPPIAEPVTEQIGDVIGPYKLREQIGEGGMGVVYVAEQEQPIRRKVALKIIKPGMDSRQVLSRFEAERQALAMMDHPNIAKVYDAGTTEAEKGTGPICRDGPEGASHKLDLSPFPPVV
ncbi:MAG: protein kinase, partial [Planctomycetes bacterium]|nr:protein kinase [Planctomycetota bacterium]